MMTDRIVTELNKESSESEFLCKMLAEVLAKVKESRGNMSKHYANWDLQDEVYRGIRAVDKDDVEQKRKGNTVKLAVPNTFAQVMTFTSFLFLLFNQNTKFFQNDPTGPEDFGTKRKDSDSITNRDWLRSCGNTILFQNLLDTARFGLAPLEVSWSKTYANVFVVPEQPTMSSLMGVPISMPAMGGYQKFTKFEGNLIRNVSPYRWFPDTNFPLRDFYKGNYCFSEEDFTLGQLRTMESNKEVAGIKHLQGLAASWRKDRGADTRMSFSLEENRGSNCDTDASPVIVTKGRVKLVPKTYMLKEKEPLGPEDFEVMYTVWIANDNRIIKLEPAQEWHQEFNYGLSQFTPDMHHTVNLSLADLVYRIQDLVTWYINSHVTSVRRVMQNRMILNKNFIEPKSYDSEGDIMVRTGVGRIDPRMVAMQLPAQDVTAGHMGDADVLTKIMQMVTGVNDNLSGQYNSGRRSATEARVVTGGAAGRMKMHAHLLWENCFGRVGRMMISNSRQSLSFESFGRIIGGADEQAKQVRYQQFKGTPEDIVSAEDYTIFDSTSASEKGYMAQNLQELLGLIMQANPMYAQQIAMALDPMKVLSEIQYLREGEPVEALGYDPGKAPLMPQLAPPNGTPGQPSPIIQP